MQQYSRAKSIYTCIPYYVKHVAYVETAAHGEIPEKIQKPAFCDNNATTRRKNAGNSTIFTVTPDSLITCTNQCLLGDKFFDQGLG